MDTLYTAHTLYKLEVTNLQVGSVETNKCIFVCVLQLIGDNDKMTKMMNHAV